MQIFHLAHFFSFRNLSLCPACHRLESLKIDQLIKLPEQRHWSYSTDSQTSVLSWEPVSVKQLYLYFFENPACFADKNGYWRKRPWRDPCLYTIWQNKRASQPKYPHCFLWCRKIFFCERSSDVGLVLLITTKNELFIGKKQPLA